MLNEKTLTDTARMALYVAPALVIVIAALRFIDTEETEAIEKNVPFTVITELPVMVTVEDVIVRTFVERKLAA